MMPLGPLRAGPTIFIAAILTTYAARAQQESPASPTLFFSAPLPANTSIVPAATAMEPPGDSAGSERGASLETTAADADAWWAGLDAGVGQIKRLRLTREEAAAMQAKLRTSSEPKTRASYLQFLSASYGRWCGGPNGGYQNCCGGGPCSTCNAATVTEGQPQASAACLAQCPPQDAMDAACAAHDTCYRWPSVVRYSAAAVAQQCGLSMALAHFCGCDATLLKTVGNIDPSTLPFQARSSPRVRPVSKHQQ